MEPQDVEYVKNLIYDELGPALEIKAREIEQRMIANVTAFQQQTETKIEKHHSENRARMQLIDDKTKEAVEAASLGAREAIKAVAGNEFILKRMDKQDAETGRIHTLMQDLIAEVKGWAGRREGESTANAQIEKTHEKWIGWAVKAGGLLVSGGIYKWLAVKFHWIGGK